MTRALGVKVQEDVFLPGIQTSLTTLFKRLKGAGIDRNFVLKRLLPPSLTAHLQKQETTEEEGEDNLVLRTAARIGRVFGWTPDAILGTAPLQLNTAAVGAARFKVTAQPDERRINAYTLYAHYLAVLMLDSTAQLPRKPIPAKADEFRKAVMSIYGSVTFEHLLRYVWSLGVPVLPHKR